MTFKKIRANDEDFIYTRYKYERIYEDFRDFAEELTQNAGNTTKQSGKSSSYARYLIRLVIIYEENFKDSIGELTNFQALKKLESLSTLKGYREYNQKENHFPSATISCFRAYVTSKQITKEEITDTALNNQLSYISTNRVSRDLYSENIELSDKKLVNCPKMRLEKKQTHYGTSYPRNMEESLAAKKKSNYTCEMDARHETFLTGKNHKPYVEAHHLIPMAAQDYFENTIDFAENIVTLCPNCHRKIHHSLPESKAKMIDFLYKRRKNLYINYGIIINKKLLLNFYGII